MFAFLHAHYAAIEVRFDVTRVKFNSFAVVADCAIQVPLLEFDVGAIVICGSKARF